MAAPLLQSTLLAELFFAGVPILVATIQPLACLFDTSVCVPACLPALLPAWLAAEGECEEVYGAHHVHALGSTQQTWCASPFCLPACALPLGWCLRRWLPVAPIALPPCGLNSSSICA